MLILATAFTVVGVFVRDLCSFFFLSQQCCSNRIQFTVLLRTRFQLTSFFWYENEHKCIRKQSQTTATKK